MQRELMVLQKKLLFTLPNTTPSLKTYAIVDSLRDESVKEKIPWSGLEYLDLWHEDLWDFEQEVPLYLVALEEENEFVDYLLENADKSLATYCISPYSLETMQRYYSFFTFPELDKEAFAVYGRKEETPKGKQWSQKVYFGAFGADTLANYIDMLYSEEKIDEFFAGAAMWLIPQEEGRRLYLAFRDKEGEVDDVSLELEGLAEMPSAALNFDTVSFPNIPNLEEYAHEITLDLKQMELLNQRDRRKFIDNVFFWAERDGWRFAYSKAHQKKEAMKLFEEANALGIESEAGVYAYIVCGLSTAIPLKEIPLYNKLRAVAHEEQKITLLHEQLWKILQFQRRSTHETQTK